MCGDDASQLTRRALLACAAFSVAAPGARAGNPRDAEELSLNWLWLDDLGGLPFVLVSADATPASDTGVGLWLLDTGAGANVVDRTWAKAAGLRAAGSQRVVTPGGPVSAARFEGIRLRLTDTALTLETVVALDLSGHSAAAGRPVHGIVGWPLLGAAPLHLDVPRGVWRFAPRAPGTGADSGGLPLPWAPGQAMPVVRADLGAAGSRLLLLDTGFAGALMVWGGAAAALATGSPSVVTVDDISGPTSVGVGLLRRLRLGDALWDEVPTLLLHQSPLAAAAALPDVEGAIGMALLADGALTIDGPRRQAVVQRREGAEPLPGGFGLGLAKPGSTPELVARRVVQSGPAAKAGVRVGDRLLAVSGLVGLPPTAPAVWAALRGIEEADFTWQAPGGPPRVTRLRRERFFPRLD